MNDRASPLSKSPTKSAPKMGQDKVRDILIWAGVILVCAGGTWWWLHNMERSWVPELRTQEKYRQHPMLAAARLLQQRGYTITEHDHISIEAIDQAPSGTLIISNNDGTMSRDQAQHLFAWVNKGNTLITFPQMRSEAIKVEKKAEESAEDEKQDTHQQEVAPFLQPQERRFNLGMQDPIADYLGISSIYLNRARAAAEIPTTAPHAEAASAPASSVSKNPAVDTEDEAYNDEEEGDDMDDGIPDSVLAANKNLVTYIDSDKSLVQLPHTSRAIQITRPTMNLINFKRGPKAWYQADDGASVRVYQYGKGHIIAMPQNIFTGHSLKANDNAQFLLDSVSLNSQAKNFTIIKGLKLARWYELVWDYFFYAVLTSFLLLCLWAWRASRRFGLLLPEMNIERRSLLEHIDASARWAWTTAIGREQLLEAARQVCRASLQRRAPELLRLAPEDMLHRIAAQTGLDATALSSAWQGPAASNPLQFTRQIQHLQQLRTHYER